MKEIRVIFLVLLFVDFYLIIKKKKEKKKMPLSQWDQNILRIGRATWGQRP